MINVTVSPDEEDRSFLIIENALENAGIRWDMRISENQRATVDRIIGRNTPTVHEVTTDERKQLSQEVFNLAVKTRDKADRWANVLGEIALGDEYYAEAELLRQAAEALRRSEVLEPQGEPSDAQIDAMQEILYDDNREGDRDVITRAWRAVRAPGFRRDKPTTVMYGSVTPDGFVPKTDWEPLS